jgi:pyruvate/2-oxoglutarate dehydrogenase complex dihydrolipoamide dehydrogenase (E3) component
MRPKSRAPEGRAVTLSALIKTDICVIGAGSGGLSVAAAAAAFGVPVVLVERGTMGGDCLNVGCVPSKALIAAGNRAQAMRDAAPFGITAAEPQINFARVHEHITGVIRDIAPNDSAERFTALGVQVIRGEAVFRDKHSVMVGDQQIEARRFVIATGSRPALPPIPGLDGVAHLTNETIFGLTRRPDRLLVLGGGPIGVELAQAMRRLGSEVVIIERESLLPREDREAAAVLRRTLQAEGVTLLEQAHVTSARQTGNRIRLVLGEGDGATTVDGSHLLVAAGRQPNIGALALAAAGIASDARGITVNKGLRTSNRRVFAIGDCASGVSDQSRFTHTANYHAGLVIRSILFRLPVKVQMQAIPRVTYCDPEIASTGLSEDEAVKSGQAIRVLRWPFAENDRARTEHRVEGLVKLIASPKGRILGVTIAGAHAGELIVPWCMAIQKNYAVKDMAELVFPYPTFAEATRRAAMSFYAPLASSPGLRRIVSFLRKFG